MRPGAVYVRPSRSIITNIAALGLSSNLQFALDAGDADSYDAGVQTDKWLDLSGNGQDFFLGSGTGADAADPTINGTAGALSSANYFSFDGGDRFTYDAANETWMENLHKDNATGSFCGWGYFPTTGAEGLLGTANTSDADGAFLGKSSADKLNWTVRGASAGVLSLVSTAAFNLNAWNFFGFGINEATGASGADLIVNGTSQSFTSTYSSPSASAATRAFGVGARTGAGNAPLLNGGRLAMVAAWSTRLTSAQLLGVFDATRRRFGI